MSERRQYGRAEWISAGAFFLIVLGMAASCGTDAPDSDGNSPSSDIRKTPSRKPTPEEAAGGGGLPVMASRFTEWPFTVSAGVLRCEGGAVTFEPPEGPRYAVNGTAQDAGYPAMQPIWADDAALGNGLKVDITEVLNKGLDLC